MATYPGDFNLDGVVDSLDRAIWFANAFTGTTWQQGDVNYDGVVDGLDRDLMLSHMGCRRSRGCRLPRASRRCPSPERWPCWPRDLLGFWLCAAEAREGVLEH